MGLTWPDDVALRTLLIGGDTLHHRPPPGLPFRIVNTYGPTENTVDSLWAEIGPVGGRPLIGKPITGVTATVVDENHEPVDVGALGELVLGGGQVAKGYRNRPELTAERFMTTKAGRVYYSGDQVRVNPEGDFEFHGRIDDQVQLLGVRVEPGEVEALLKADARVRDAACLPLRSGAEAIGLIAHVSTEGDVAEPEQLAAELKRLLSAQLPAAIVPKAIEIHRSLPYTAAGKLDRRQLERGRAAADDPAPAMAEDDLRSIWLRSVRGAVAGDDRQSFWDLGGDSLGAIGLLLGIETAFGVQIPVGAFLEDPSLSGLRHMIARGRSPTIIRLVKGAGPPLVLWYSASGDLESYQRLLPLLKGREVIGVLSPALADPAYAPESIEAAVTGGLDALREFGVDEVSAHIGFSWAGLLAFEAARQAEPRGAPSPLVVMIGTLPPLAKYRFWTHKTNDVKWVIERLVKLVFSPSYRRTVKLENIDRAHVWRHEKDINGRHYALGRAYRPGAKAKVSILYMREKFGHVYMRERPLFGRRDRGWSEWVSLDPEAHVLDVDHIGLINGDALGQIETLIRDRLADRFPVGIDAD